MKVLTGIDLDYTSREAKALATFHGNVKRMIATLEADVLPDAAPAPARLPGTLPEEMFGRPAFYQTADGAVFCAQCASARRTEIVLAGALFEDRPLFCDGECGAYIDPFDRDEMGA